MKNWARNVEFFPAQILQPSSTEEAQEIVKKHLEEKKTIRVRGSSHSWTPLIETNESFLHLDNMQGVISADPLNQLILAKAGTKLSVFGRETFKHNLSLPNQGDIDAQSLAGALSTGTHGTGIQLQSISNQLQNLTIVTGTGEILKIDAQQNPDLLKAASVSLGTLGLITEVALKMIPSYKLKVESWAEDMNVCLPQVQSHIQKNRHFEMFYFPVGDWCLLKKMNITEEKVSNFLQFQKISNLVIENWLYELLHLIAYKTISYKKLDSLVRKFSGETSYVNWSHCAFPTQRTIRFMEMEYNLPIEKFEEVLQEIKFEITKNNFQTLFPIEIRFVKGDDLWLSPAYKRDSVYFAVHSYIKEDFRPYFHAMEKIFKRHGGRPHWGKWHSMKREEFVNIYPKWTDFVRLRLELDPSGVWLNSYLRKLLLTNWSIHSNL